MTFISLLLIGGGALASFYIYKLIKSEPSTTVVLKEEIIPYNNEITLTHVTSDNLGSEFKNISATEGVSIVRITDANGLTVQKSKEFFNSLKISPPPALFRTLKDQYVLGVINKNQENHAFLIIMVNDFGGAFSAMLEWEESMNRDLAFLKILEDSIPLPVVPDVLATTSSSVVSTSSPKSNSALGTTTKIIATTTTKTKTLLRPEVFAWKDIIIKNKDTRGLVNEKGKSQMAYTFLDKNTILIAESVETIGDMTLIYTSRSFTR
jgi:hypothetical protein